MKNSQQALTSGSLIDGARMYAAAADAVNDKLPNSLHVLSQLLGTSIELTLKAYLRHEGYDEKQLRVIGHNLRELLDHAEKNGFYSTGSRRFVLAVCGLNYMDRLFVYPQNGNMHIISPWRLRQMANELLVEVFEKVKGIDVLSAGKDSPGLCIQSTYSEDLDASNWARITENI